MHRRMYFSSEALENHHSFKKNFDRPCGIAKSNYVDRTLREYLYHRSYNHYLQFLSWSAVVRGAVMHGIEKTSRPNVVHLKTCPRSYGIVLNEMFKGSYFRSDDRSEDSITGEAQAQGQITWLVKKGDLVLSDEGKTSEKEFRVTFTSGRDIDERKRQLSIYEYEDDDLPDRYRNAHQGTRRHETRQ